MARSPDRSTAAGAASARPAACSSKRANLTRFTGTDKLAQAGGYPRLSCQISVDRPMTIRILTDKLIWGKLPR